MPVDISADRLPDDARRVLVLGASGAGKSTWVARRFRTSHEGDAPWALVNLDPGLSSWAPPTCVSLHLTPQHTGLLADALICIGSLNPVRHQGRFLAAAARLLRHLGEAPALIDAPGVSRGRVAIELIDALIDVTAPTHVALIDPGDSDTARLREHLARRASPRLVTWPSDEAARRLGRGARRRLRAERWAAFMCDAEPRAVAPDTLLMRGFPPREEAGWVGRLAALLSADGATLAVGRVRALGEPAGDEFCAPGLELETVTVSDTAVATTLLVTETREEASGRVRTAPRPRRSAGPKRPKTTAWTLPDRETARAPIAWPESAGRAPFKPTLLNPLFGDPALLLRERRGGRGLLFDIGWLEPLPGKLLHQVTDLFISHAHMDHLQGFVKLLRLLLGPGDSVRIYGPPHIDQRILALLRGFDFNLIGEDGPTFDIHAYGGEDALEWVRVRCGPEIVVEARERREVEGHVLLREPGLVVRSRRLMHSIPVLGFRAEMTETYAPDRSPRAGPPLEFALAYVTDIGDTPENRRVATWLARDADLFVCESMFLEEHRERATTTAHLTTQACAEIAREAGVRRLVPFHFSPRYSDCLERVYAELTAVFPRVFAP